MADPFSVVPISLLSHDLTSQELRVMIALLSFGNGDNECVWPSLESIAERSGIKDKTQVSKVTTKLASRGLIVKKKRGFTGGNIYKINANITNLECSSKLENISNPKLEESTNSKLEESTKYKEVTIEVTNEVTKITQVKIPDWVPFDEWKAFCEMRIKIKRPLTDYAKKLMFGKLEKLAGQGHKPAEVLNQSIAASWQDVFPVKTSNTNQPAKHRNDFTGCGNGQSKQSPIDNSAAGRVRANIARERAAEAAARINQDFVADDVVDVWPQVD